MARQEFPRAVKVAAIKRATVNGQVYCEACGCMTKGKFEIDHVRPDGLLGEPTIENARILCVACHKEKTKSDVRSIAKAKRVEARNLGIRKSGKGFPRREKEKLELTKVVSRRPMYEEING